MIPQKLLWFTAAAFTAWGATALPSATLNQNQVITGQLEGTVESFRGIPFANPPLGDLRFKHPTDYTGSYQGLKADNFRGACMQLDPAKVFTILDNVLNLASIIPSSIRGPLYDIADGSVSMSEDCLYLNVYRPKGTNSTAKLPVMVWIYGGAFLLGSTATYPGDNYIMESVNMGQPVIFVSIAYRTGPYGFLGGEAITNEGSTNSGLHDQRKALEWIQDNIANFGGDPSRVMIFGESAGSMSVAHQMAAYGGNNTYKGNQLFTSAIMQSGGPLPFYNTESYAPTSQYNRFVQYAGCQNAGSDADTLACLRSKSTAVLADAQNSYGLSDLYGLMPEFFGFSPRPDGDILPDSTFNLYKQGKVAQIPFITGNQEDEGTLFAAVAINATTTADVKKWLASFITQASSSTLDNVLSLYNANPINGSPFRTLFLNAITPQWKRIAALITDLLFHSPRRIMLENSSQTRYTYLSTTLHNLVPVLGTFHANDVIFQYYLNLGPYKAYRKYFISFANNHDPNVNTGLTKWNPYTTANKEMLQIPWLSPYMGTDSFRRESINYLMTTNELQAKK